MSDYVVSAYGEALFKLMKKKSIEKITVDELCEAGGIGRARRSLAGFDHWQGSSDRGAGTFPLLDLRST